MLGALYVKWYKRLPIQKVHHDGHLELLNEDESRMLHRIHIRCMVVAAVLDIIGFILLYQPLYWWGDILFFKSHIAIPFTSITFDLSLTYLLWSFFLIFMEITLLVFLNIYMVHEIAVATGFITQNNKEKKAELLLGISQEVKSKEITKYGINPFQGLSPWALFLMVTYNRLKGLVSSYILKYLIQGVFGRYATRALLDYSGVVIYASLNVFATRKVYREAKVIIMGHNLIKMITRRIKSEIQPTADEKELLYDTLQYIAVSKRDFHKNHYYLTRKIFEMFDIKPKDEHYLNEDFTVRFPNASREVQDVCRVMIILGFLLDGELSFREKLRIEYLNQNGVLDETYEQIKGQLQSFLDGRGVDHLVNRYL